MPNNYYKNTIETYNKLGKRYVGLIQVREITGRPEFIKRLSKDNRILDVGCAGGRDSKVFVKAGFQVVGIDAAPNLLIEARKLVPQAKFQQMDVRHLKFKPNSFDAIWANAILLHVLKKDLPKVLKKFYQILKPQGLLSVVVKKGTGMDVETNDLTGIGRTFVYFSKREMEQYVSKAGFKIVKSKINPDDLGRKAVKWISILARKSQ